MNEISIDVRDLDYTWFENVRVFVDDKSHQYLFPKESADRLGELEDETGDYKLIDDHVTAKRYERVIDGVPTLVWGVAFDAMPTRRAVDRGY